MPFAELTLENLKQLDGGRINEAFTHDTKRAIEDCNDRPGDKSKRTVTVTFEFTPTISGNAGDVEDVLTDISIKCTLPKRKSKTYQMQPRKGGHLAFGVNNPEDPAQGHLADVHPKAFRNDPDEDEDGD